MIRTDFLKVADAAGDLQAGDEIRPMQIVPLAQANPLAGSADLVARALAILDQDKTRSDYRSSHSAKITGEVATRSVGLELTRAGDLQLQRRVLSDGAECILPIRYFDVQCLVATFLVEPNQASELLVAGLQPVLQEDGKAIVDLYCIEYRKTDIGAYNEVGLTIRATAPGDPIAANFVANLPVTTAVASRAGREIWGYNKFVAAIDVSSKDKSFSTVLRDSDNEIIGALEGERGASAPVQAANILTFSLHQGRLIKTVIRVLTPSLVSNGDSFTFKVGNSRHPMTGNLRTVALDRARPVLINYSNPFQALLFPGRAL
jgi:Acetoacetate decarboxylase (ADC)